MKRGKGRDQNGPARVVFPTIPAWVGAAVLAGLSPAAQAWEFTPGLPCLLTHESLSAEVELTYDPREPLYSITITRAEPWPPATIFSMRFEGPAELTISTARHSYSADGRAVTVVDRGFGNVLNGLQFNRRAVAMLGEAEVAVSLTGAEQPVQDFRLCRAAPGV